MIKGLHPRSAVIYLGVYFLAALISSHYLPLGFMLGAVLVFSWRCDKGKNLRQIFRLAFPLILLMVIINVLFRQEGSILLWKSGEFPWLGPVLVYAEPLGFALVMGLKLLLILGVFAVLNQVLPPERLLDASGPQAGPGVMLAAISLGLIPQLQERARVIRLVQAYRGCVPAQGNWGVRVRSYLPFLSNLLRSSLEGAMERAQVMQVRAYGSGVRSFYRQEVWQTADTIVTLFSLVVLIFFISTLGRGGGWMVSGQEAFSPISPGVWIQAAAALLLAIPLLLSGRNNR